jgi:hypothetical protein
MGRLYICISLFYFILSRSEGFFFTSLVHSIPFSRLGASISRVAKSSAFRWPAHSIRRRTFTCATYGFVVRKSSFSFRFLVCFIDVSSHVLSGDTFFSFLFVPFFSSTLMTLVGILC